MSLRFGVCVPSAPIHYFLSNLFTYIFENPQALICQVVWFDVYFDASPDDGHPEQVNCGQEPAGMGYVLRFIAP